MKTRKNKGFSLIELMITIFVVGLVCALLVGYMYGASQKSLTLSKVNKVQSDINELNSAQSLFFARFGDFGNKDEIVAAGIVKSWPEADRSIMDAECVEESGHVFEYQYWATDVSGGSDLEVMAVLPCVKEEYAVVMNDRE